MPAGHIPAPEAKVVASGIGNVFDSVGQILLSSIFMADKFSEESYRRFLGNAQNLFGKWKLEESVPFSYDRRYPTIHECWIKSEDLPLVESVRVDVTARRLSPAIPWGFDFEWGVHFETGTGRSPLGLAVQLGAWLLAMHNFRFILALDRDSSLKNEPTEFRSLDAVVEHIRRLLKEEFEWPADLKRRGMVNEDGYLLLPPHAS